MSITARLCLICSTPNDPEASDCGGCGLPLESSTLVTVAERGPVAVAPLAPPPSAAPGAEPERGSGAGVIARPQPEPDDPLRAPAPSPLAQRGTPGTGNGNRRRNGLAVAAAAAVLAVGIGVALRDGGGAAPSEPSAPRPAAAAPVADAEARIDEERSSPASHVAEQPDAEPLEHSEPEPTQEPARDPDEVAAVSVVRRHFARLAAGDYDAAFRLMSAAYRDATPNWPSARAAAQAAIDIAEVGPASVNDGRADVTIKFYARDRQMSPGSDRLCRRFSGTVHARRFGATWRYHPPGNALDVAELPPSNRRCP